MHEIIKKELLDKDTWCYRLVSQEIAQKQRVGQFVIINPLPKTKRTLLSIADADPNNGWIEIIFKIYNKSTQALAQLNAGEKVSVLLGPFGRPSHIENFGNCLCVADYTGIISLYPILKGLKNADNNIKTIINTKDKISTTLQKEIQAITNDLFIVSDDSSSAGIAKISTLVEDMIKKNEYFDYAMINGSPMMMKIVSSIAVQANILTYVSLSSIMVEGAMICGTCNYQIDDKNKPYLACLNGTEINAALVDWFLLENRLINNDQFLSLGHNCH